jgi:hypothetical protein
MTPEAAVKNDVKKLLSKMKAWFFMPVQTGYGKTGVPDVLACVPYTIRPEDVGKTIGVFVGVETKAPGKRHTVTPLQQRELHAIANAGGIALVCDDVVQLDEVLTK